MTEVFQLRVNRKLMAEAKSVAKEIGTSPAEVVRLLFAQMVKRRTIPFPLQADPAEDEVFTSPRRRAKLWDEINEGKAAAR